MPAGRFRHRVDIDRQVQGEPDPDTGARAPIWQLFLANEAAEVVPLSGREFIAADAKRGQMVARCTVRYRDGYEPSMRLRHKGAFYNIEAVLPDPKFARHLTLMLSTGVSDGR